MRAAASREAIFAIDGQRKVVMWARAAEEMLGFAAAEALGQPCWQILKGGDVFGRPLCCDQCQACLDGTVSMPPAPHQMLLEHRGGRHMRLVHELLPLPAGTGPRALVLLWEPQSYRSYHPKISDAQPESGSRTFGDIIRALSTLGVVSDSSSSTDFYANLDASLDRVLALTGSEAAEIFLWNRATNEMCLTAHRGLFPSAFRQITRFRPGQGYPGMVAANGEPIIVHDLAQDDRYLRTRVKEKGVRSYVSVPLRSGRDVIGCLNIASRRTQQTQDYQAQVLSWLAAPIASAAELAILRARDRVSSLIEEAAPAALPVQILNALLEVSGADVATLNLWPGTGRGYHRATSPDTIACASRPGINDCPARKNGQTIVAGPGCNGPSACRHALENARHALCIPIGSGGDVTGAVNVRFLKNQPAPTRSLALLGAMCRTASRAFAEVAVQADSDSAGPITAGGSPRRSSAAATGRAANAPRTSELGVTGEVTAPFLDIRCFGGFHVFRDGELLPPPSFGRRQSHTLLKMLVTRRGRPVSTEFISEALWPEAEPEVTNRRLWVVVHDLRATLDPSLKPGEPARFVHRNGGAYVFDPAVPYRIDVEDFLRDISRGQKAEADGDHQAAIEAYQRAVRYYRGDFLEEEPYSDWCLAEREYLREVFLDLLGKLSFLYASSGQLDRSIACHHRALLVDGLREEVHRELMRCQYKAGRRDEALRQYAECREILAKELDVEPLPETTLLYNQILREEIHSGGSSQV